MTTNDPYHVYFAGPLFSSAELVGNALLADAIHQVSEGRFVCHLPQTQEQRECKPYEIRNQDLKMVMSADVALFHFDGTDLDDGTVVEFMLAKFLDIPAVVLRSDFRSGGDQGVSFRKGNEDERFPWNLMASSYPRTETLLENSIVLFQEFMGSYPIDPVESAKVAVKAAKELSTNLAVKVSKAFERVLGQEPVLRAELREQVYSWAALFPGSHFSSILSEEEVIELLHQKVRKGLL